MARFRRFLASLYRNIRRLLELRIRERVTVVGVVCAFTTALVGVAAFISANNLLFLLLAALLATFLISGFISRLGLAGLEVDIEVPEHIPARRRISGRLLIKNDKAMVPSFSITFSGAPDSGLTQELYIPVIPGGAMLRESVDLMFPRRGLYRDNIFYLTSRFPFGFTQRRATVRLEREILVYPAMDAQPGFEEMVAEMIGDIEAQQRGRSDDFYRIRPYEPLESARHVDWKATAHTGDLQVREFAREEEEMVTLMLDVDASDQHKEWFERAVECCAFVVWELTRGNRRVRMAANRFDQTVPDDCSVYAILRFLALVEREEGSALPLADEEKTYQIAITTNPEKLATSGWRPNRILDATAFAHGILTDTPPAAGRKR